MSLDVSLFQQRNCEFTENSVNCKYKLPFPLLPSQSLTFALCKINKILNEAEATIHDRTFERC